MVLLKGKTSLISDISSLTSLIGGTGSQKPMQSKIIQFIYIWSSWPIIKSNNTGSVCHEVLHIKISSKWITQQKIFTKNKQTDWITKCSSVKLFQSMFKLFSI